MRSQIMRVLFVLLILSACDRARPESTEPDESPTPPPSAVTVRIWHSETDLQSALESLLSDYQAEQPHITPVLTLQDPQTFQADLSAALLAGAGPDLILTSARNLGALVQNGQLLPLDAAHILEEALAQPLRLLPLGYWAGTFYGYPLRADVPVLYRNKQMRVESISNLDDFEVSARRAGAIIPPDFLLTSAWLTLRSQVTPFSAGNDLNTDAANFAAYLRWLSDLNRLDQVRFSADPAPFMAGEVAYYVGYSHELPRMRAALGDDLDLEFLALNLDETHQSGLLGDVLLMLLSINATEASANAAQELIIYLSAPDQQRRLSDLSGYAPLRMDESDDLLHIRINISVAGALYIPPDARFYSERLPRYNTAIAQVLSGLLTPEEAAATLFNNP